MKTLSDLSKFIESETFDVLDEDVRVNIVMELREAVCDICEQMGIADDEIKQSTSDDEWKSRVPDLYLGLVPIKAEAMPAGYEAKWVLFGDFQGLIPVIRAKGKYGLFRPKFWGMGMDPEKYYSIKKPFRYDDVRISVPCPGCGEYNGYLAVCENDMWSVLAVDIDSHPLKMVDNCSSFEQAKKEVEHILGQPSPYPWFTFDEFDLQNNSLLGSDEVMTSSHKGGYKRGPSSQFKVVFPDGTVYNYKKAVKTFIDSLVKIGLDKVQQVGIIHAGCNLVSDEPRYKEGPNTCQKSVGGKYIYTKLGNDNKIADLVKISNYFHLDLTIE